MFHTSDNSYTPDELGQAIKFLRRAYRNATFSEPSNVANCIYHILYKFLPALYKMVSGENLDE